MGVSQQSDPQVVDLSGPSSNSTETSSSETTVRFKDVDSSSPSVLFVDDEPPPAGLVKLAARSQSFCCRVVLHCPRCFWKS